MILDNIVQKRLEQLDREKSLINLAELKKRLAERTEESVGPGRDFLFERVLKSRELTLIAEVKKASPSKGLISHDFNPVEIAVSYRDGGAGAISVLTEEAFFLGKNSYLVDIAKTVNIPILRKDFIVDPYQIYHSKYLGASVVLLIVAILDRNRLVEYLDLAKSLGLDVIVEVHTEEELKVALETGAKIIGINNRNLKTFEVDLNTTKRLMEMVPADRLVISESGIRNAEDIKFLKELGVKGVLIGETLMRSDNIGRAIEGLGL